MKRSQLVNIVTESLYEHGSLTDDEVVVVADSVADKLVQEIDDVEDDRVLLYADPSPVEETTD